MKMSKYFYTGTLLIVFVAMLIVGCVQIPSEAPPLPEFKASVRFMNTMMGGEPAALAIDGVQKATLSAGEASDYMEVNAGNRIVAVNDTVVYDTLYIQSDFKGTIYITDADFVLSRERWTHTNTALADSVMQIHVAQMATEMLTVTMVDTSGVDVERADMEPGEVWKSNEPAGLFTVTVTTATDTLDSVPPISLPGNSKTTLVVLGASGSLSVVQLDNE